jgi:hypothetical protein
LRCSAKKAPLARSRISASLTGVPVKVEVVDILGQRQLGDGQLVLDRARLLLGDLSAQEIADNAWRLVPALDAGGHHLVVGRSHTVELERRHELENVGALHQEALRRLS